MNDHPILLHQSVQAIDFHRRSPLIGCFILLITALLTGVPIGNESHQVL